MKALEIFILRRGNSGLLSYSTFVLREAVDMPRMPGTIGDEITLLLPALGKYAKHEGPVNRLGPGQGTAVHHSGWKQKRGFLGTTFPGCASLPPARQ